VIVSVVLNHANIIDGCRLTRAVPKVHRHKDMNELEQRLEESKGARRVLVITDGVSRMDGDIAPLPEIVELAERHGATAMVDDAHAGGLLEKNGRGTVDQFGLHGRVHIQVGTLSKATGALGGYIAGCRALREWPIQRGRTYLFSTSHPPSVAAAPIAAIDVLLEEPQLINRHWENTRYVKTELARPGFDTGAARGRSRR